MLPVSTPAGTRIVSGKKRGFFRRKVELLFSPELFHLKLLLGTAVGVLVTIVVAVTNVVFTFRHQQRDTLRAHTIEVIRLSSVVENDIAALENAHRSHLLTRNGVYGQNSGRLQDLFLQHSKDLADVLVDRPEQRKRILKIREIVRTWLTTSSLSTFELFHLQGEQAQVDGGFNSPALEEAQDALQTINREEQIKFTQGAREQEWAIQGTQILTFISKMGRAASDMQKENRGYLLTGDPAFVDGYEKAASDFYTFQGYLSVLVADEPDGVKRLNRIGERMETWITQCAVPSIEAKHNGRGVPDSVRTIRSDSLMKNVRRAMEQFENEQMAIYDARFSAATRDRILTATGVDLFCAFAAGLILASGSYSFVLCRRHRQKLQSADTRIRSVIDNILDGMVTLDENGSIYSMNSAAKQMFGYRENEFFGDDFARLVPQYLDRDADASPVPCDWAHLAGCTGGTVLALARTQGRATFPVEISLSETVVEEQQY